NLRISELEDVSKCVTSIPKLLKSPNPQILKSSDLFKSWNPQILRSLNSAISYRPSASLTCPAAADAQDPDWARARFSPEFAERPGRNFRSRFRAAAD